MTTVSSDPGATRRKSATVKTYQGEYEDFARVKAAALKAGAGQDDSFLDYVEPTDYVTAKTFATLADAVAWVQSEVNAMKTVFGAGDVYAIEAVARPARCTYCTCRGERVVRRYAVSDTGVEAEEAVDDCAWDDD